MSKYSNIQAEEVKSNFIHTPTKKMAKIKTTKFEQPSFKFNPGVEKRKINLFFLICIILIPKREDMYNVAHHKTLFFLVNRPHGAHRLAEADKSACDRPGEHRSTPEEHGHAFAHIS